MPLSAKIKSMIRSAWDDGYPLIVATAGTDGPVMGPKGSMIVYDDSHLAYWERTKGKLLDAVKQEPRICILYANFKAQHDGVLESGYLRFFGTAELHESGPVREKIFSMLLPREQTHAGADKGLGVLVKITSAADIRGKPIM